MTTDLALESGEVVLYEGRTGLSFGFYMGAAVLTIIPPFIWGIGLLLVGRWRAAILHQRETPFSLGISCSRLRPHRADIAPNYLHLSREGVEAARVGV